MITCVFEVWRIMGCGARWVDAAELGLTGLGTLATWIIQIICITLLFIILQNLVFAAVLCGFTASFLGWP